ncbi:protein S100-A9 [Pteropus vampyrus]|uniref:Protein S100-A9 n=1 Tax=Pteropus vampyrus TaxID=132908 RepID=A0A6P3RLF0_PTEVA|nr:protein S100-A9 [Pteropus vampyrus]
MLGAKVQQTGCLGPAEDIGIGVPGRLQEAGAIRITRSQEPGCLGPVPDVSPASYRTLQARSPWAFAIGHLLGRVARPWPRPALTTLSPNPQKQKKNDKAINHILEDLDTNGDKELSFEEFAILVARLTEASHEEMHKNAPPGEGHSHGPGFGESHSSCQNQNQGQSGHGHSHGGHGHSHEGHGHSH